MSGPPVEVTDQIKRYDRHPSASTIHHHRTCPEPIVVARGLTIVSETRKEDRVSVIYNRGDAEGRFVVAGKARADGRDVALTNTDSRMWWRFSERNR